jgi:hypothetical protein
LDHDLGAHNKSLNQIGIIGIESSNPL